MKYYFNEVDVVQIINELVFHLVGGNIKELQEIDTRILQVIERLTDAALISGFSDSLHLTNTFKKIVGLTPKVLNKV